MVSNGAGVRDTVVRGVPACAKSPAAWPPGRPSPTSVCMDAMWRPCSPFPFAAPLAVIIEVNGFRVETKGEVRVAYPSFGVEILFTPHVRGGDRARLRGLLASLSRPSVILGSPASARLQPTPKFESVSSVSNPAAVLKAWREFLAQRRTLRREELVRILAKEPKPGNLRTARSCGFSIPCSQEPCR